MSPTDRIVARLRAREADRATRDAAIQAARDAYEAKWPAEVSQLLDDAAALAGVDERPPELEKPKRGPGRPRKPKPSLDLELLPVDQVEALLKLPISALAKEQLTPAALRQLLAAEEGAIDARPAYVAHLRGRL